MGEEVERWGASEDDGLRAASSSEEKVAPTASTWDDPGYYELSFAVGRCRRYHAKMQRFYETWHDLVMAANAFLGAGAFISLIGGTGTAVATVLAGLVACASATSTVFRPSRKAIVHSDLNRAFTELAADIVRSDATPKNLRRLVARRLTIEAGEPPVRRLVDLAAQNEECKGRGLPAQFPLSGPQRWLGYVVDFGHTGIEKRRQAALKARQEGKI